MGDDENSIQATTHNGIRVIRVVGCVPEHRAVEYVRDQQQEIGRLPTIWDLRACNLQHQSYEGWKKYLLKTHEAVEHRRGVRVALVADSAAKFGMSRMFEELSQMKAYPVHVRAFRTMEEAEAWVSKQA